MKVLVMTLTHNNADILPFFLRHYSTFADEIRVWDDLSTDGTVGILAQNPKTKINDWPHRTGIDEDQFLLHWQAEYPKARGEFDWVMVVDSDEFIFHPIIDWILLRELAVGTEVIETEGFNMTGDGLPKNDGRSQIWELSQMGVRAPVYSKPVVFRPEVERMDWNRGRHALGGDPIFSSEPWLKLLHYRYMGADYTRAKNAKNYARCGLLSGDKGAAWSCSPNYTGEHSAQWSEEAKRKSFNVIQI
jgi:glycosyltransferase involved in cell wall biosynthesis